MYWLWAIIIGGVAGAIAKWLSPSPNNPQGFILTIILGIVGSVVFTWLGQAIHLYGPGEGAGLIGSVIGAVIVLAIYHWITGRQTSTYR